jgi:hypothetical protein
MRIKSGTMKNNDDVLKRVAHVRIAVQLAERHQRARTIVELLSGSVGSGDADGRKGDVIDCPSAQKRHPNAVSY